MLNKAAFIWSKMQYKLKLIKSLVSHNPSENILICWFAAFIIIINAENSCTASCFCAKVYKNTQIRYAQFYMHSLYTDKPCVVKDYCV